MSDIELQRALSQFSAEPNRDTLVRYLILLERNQLLTEGYLVELLMEYPFGPKMWPWFYNSADDLGGKRYQQAVHISMLRLMARIQREVLFEIILRWEPLQQFIQVIHVIWKWLLDMQLAPYGDAIVDRYDNESVIRKALAAKEIGVFLPKILWLDWRTPWKWNSWGQYPADANPIATAIFDGDLELPQTVTKAFRCGVDVNAEPTPGCKWIQVWKLGTRSERVDRLIWSIVRGDPVKPLASQFDDFPRWVDWGVSYLQRHNYDSKILVPYNEFCYSHQLDFIPIQIEEKIVSTCPVCHQAMEDTYH